MAQIIKRPFKTFNGTDWDTHHFETDSELIKTKYAYLYRSQIWQILNHDLETNIQLDLIENNDEDMIKSSEYANGIIIRKAGLYLITGGLNFQATGRGGSRMLAIRRNETHVLMMNTTEANTAIDTSMTIGSFAYLAVNDKIKLSARQNSGASLGVGNFIPTGAYLSVVRIGGGK